jgi:hypothetical protein
MTDDPKYGPKMMALPNDKWRHTVLTYMAGGMKQGTGNRGYTEAFRQAGCWNHDESAGYVKGNGIRVNASRFFHDERVQAAIQEEAGRRLKGMLPAALDAVGAILENPQHGDHAKVALGMMDRAGLAAAVEHKHTVGLANDTEMLAEIKLLAERNGIPLAQLLGDRIAKTIEHEPLLIEHEPVPSNYEEEDY